MMREAKVDFINRGQISTLCGSAVRTGYFWDSEGWIAHMNRLKHEIRHRRHQLEALLTLDLPMRAVPWAYDAVPQNPVREAGIPRLVHQTWVENQFGRRMRAGMLEFRRKNPTHAFSIVLNNEVERSVADAWGNHPIFEILQRARIGPLRADLWRYMTVHTHGGWYFDIKSRLEVPLLELEKDGASGVVSLEPFTDPDLRGTEADDSGAGAIGTHWLSNWAFAFAPNHPFLTKLIEDIVAIYPDYQGVVFEDPKTAVLEFTGPRRFARTFRAFERENPGHSVVVAGVDFGGVGTYSMKGSSTRFLTRRSYIAARNQIIVA